MPPKVSILTAIYNSADYLAQAVESILAQSYRDFEFIIVDDASTDASAQILDRYTDARIVRLQNGENLGLTASLNRALEVARGEFLVRQDGDDISREHRLAHQLDFLELHPEVGVLGTQMEIMDASGETIGNYELPLSHGLLAWNLFFDRSFAHPTVMMRRQLIQEVGGYDESFPVAQDFDLWTRLVQQTRFANLSEELVRYRNHPGAVGYTRAREQYKYVLRARHALAARLLDSDFPLDLFAWIESSQQSDCTLLETQQRAVVNILMRLEAAYLRGGLITKEDQEEVYADMLSKLLQVGHCGEQASLREAGFRQSLVWGLSNPRKALGKIFRRGDRHLTLDNIPSDRHPETAGESSDLSVVVLSFERMAGLRAMLESLHDQQFEQKKLELLLFNNSPQYELTRSGKDAVSKMIARFGDVKVINSDHNWSTASRYALTTLAGSETILFLDDDLVLGDPHFVKDMHTAFLNLEEPAILSCWNELWVAWDERQLQTVSLDFSVPGIQQIVPTDTCGPGISMFQKSIVQHRSVQETVMRPEYPKADDMGFALISALELGSQPYYFPAHGRLNFHDQQEKGALDTRSGRYADLMALFKGLFHRGYTPVIERLEQFPQPQARLVEWAAENLPITIYDW